MIAININIDERFVITIVVLMVLTAIVMKAAFTVIDMIKASKTVSKRSFKLLQWIIWLVAALLCPALIYYFGDDAWPIIKTLLLNFPPTLHQ